ncbi:zinc-binding dehydrogenase [Companilactobacillus mishanensis]|uniref:NADP-dependent oxidoreductase n=1 Tax=Companilactobacillus mishanensis TaxID=2486008 RepID=A0A5P0ZJ25_9LACO|nr:zinc-binding dehydrogenase [Companilactobacillus mishanensis]MQS53038.1 NADP-dependent oxidoreductase [Companilactobacillus mishanensis]
MQAIIQESFNGIEDLKIKSINEPRVGPLSALIETKYTPVLPYDWRTETGELRNIRPVNLPITIGYSFSGVVKETGIMARKNLIGRKVIGVSQSGTSQQLNNILVSPFLFTLPDDVSLAEGATIIGGADAALSAVRKIHAESGDTVLITGSSGGVGTYMIQFLKMRNVHVIALGHPKNKDFLLNVGADEFIDYTSNLVNQLQAHPEIHKVLDTVGRPELLSTISQNLNELQIVSLSLPNFRVPKSNQSFSFTQGPIMPSDYKKVIQQLSNNELHAYIQEIFDFKDVIKAQNISKNSHSSGRILLKY